MLRACPFGVYMLLVPNAEGLSMRAISCKVISSSAHKAVMFLSLVMIHHLSHSKAEPFDEVWLRSFRVWWFRVRWEQFLFPQHCNPSCRSRVSPVFISIGIRRS